MASPKRHQDAIKRELAEQKNVMRSPRLSESIFSESAPVVTQQRPDDLV